MDACARWAAENASRTKTSQSGESSRTIAAFSFSSIVLYFVSSSRKRTLSRRSISPPESERMAAFAFSPQTSSTNFTGFLQAAPSRSECCESEMQSGSPFLPWCASTTTLAPLPESSRTVSACPAILSDGSTLFVFSSTGQFRSTRTNAVLPAKSKVSSVCM